MAEQNVPNKLGINILSSEQQEKLRQFKVTYDTAETYTCSL